MSKYEGNSNPTPINASALVGGGQWTIDIGIEQASQMVIRKWNNAAMEMAITGILYCENIPNKAVGSSCFQGMMKLFCLVGKDFTGTNKKKNRGKKIFMLFLCVFILIP